MAQLDRIGLDIFEIIIIDVPASSIPEGSAQGTTQRSGSQEAIRPGNVVDDDFWVFPQILG